MSKWIVSADQNDNSAYCGAVVLFHHAGGAASGYMPYRQYISEHYRLLVVQLPGRESHLSAELCHDGFIAATHILNVLNAQLDNLPVVFFGHSMGAALALQTAALAKKGGQLNLLQLFISSRRPPHIEPFEADLAHATDQQVLDAVLHYGAVPEELLADKDFRDTLTNKIRADYGIANTIHRQTSINMLGDLPITVYGGIADNTVSVAHLYQWSFYSSGAFHCVMLTGDHFYLFDLKNQQIIARALVAVF